MTSASENATFDFELEPPPVQPAIPGGLADALERTITALEERGYLGASTAALVENARALAQRLDHIGGGPKQAYAAASLHSEYLKALDALPKPAGDNVAGGTDPLAALLRHGVDGEAL
ncbi:hypothetical protein [Gryllotalpicola koreensis]|uniref:Uncharacterized protein n=1 Tax=Gryllotalpicola koreensis TaxID=993086 RepID=A0ABP8A6T2_9MICO